MKISKKIIQEAIEKEVLKENPLSGIIAGAKGVAGGIKGTFQNMGANYRLSNIGSQMDQFAKKSKKAWDVNSKKAEKQIDKMMSSKNQDVVAAAQTVDQQLQQADRQIAQTLDFVSNGIARTMIAAGGSSSQGMKQAMGSRMGTAGMENALNSKGIYPKMIGKKEYIQVVNLMQKISKLSGGMQALQNFENQMVQRGIRPDRLGKREYGVEVISFLENEFNRLVTAQQNAPDEAEEELQQQQQPAPVPTANVAQANKTGQVKTPLNLQNKTSATVPDEEIADNEAPTADHQGVLANKRGYGVDKRQTPNREPPNLTVPQQRPWSKPNVGQIASQAASAGDDSKDFEQILGNIQTSKAFDRTKSWKNKSSNLFPKISDSETEEAPSPQEVQTYSTQGEKPQKVLAGNIQNVAPEKRGFHSNTGRSQMAPSSKFSRADLSQEKPRYSPYSAEEAPEALPLTKKKVAQPPPIPEIKPKHPRVEKAVEKVLGTPNKEKPESSVSLYYKMLQKDLESGKQITDQQMKDLEHWKKTGRAPKSQKSSKAPTKKPRKPKSK